MSELMTTTFYTLQSVLISLANQETLNKNYMLPNDTHRKYFLSWEKRVVMNMKVKVFAQTVKCLK